MVGINIPESLITLSKRSIHSNSSHPIGIIKDRILGYFGSSFKSFEHFDPKVSVQDNFDSLLIPETHVSRSLSDTYYFDKNTVLRTHTSAHQATLLKQGENRFLVCGAVFRRDEIDSSHYPIFHQMEGVKIIPGASKDEIVNDLKNTLSGLVEFLFPTCSYEMVPSYFPFTDPSFEIEVEWNSRKLEILGSGVIHSTILSNCSVKDSGWAFGLGLERLAMVLFDIPDIRLFWSEDPRFSSQFSQGEITKFQPYSKYPPCYKDLSFWIPKNYSSNDLFEHVRESFGDLVESVNLIDQFSKDGKTSHCYRINCRSLDRSLQNEEVDQKMYVLREMLALRGFELR